MNSHCLCLILAGLNLYHAELTPQEKTSSSEPPVGLVWAEMGVGRKHHIPQWLPFLYLALPKWATGLHKDGA